MSRVAKRTEYALAAGSTQHTLGPEEFRAAHMLLAGDSIFSGHVSEMFAFHVASMSDTMGMPVLVFTRSGFMAALLAHYRPKKPTFAFTNSEAVQRRLALYHGVHVTQLDFQPDREATFTAAIQTLKEKGLVREGDEVAILQSGLQPIWRDDSTHVIQVRRVV